MEQSPVVCFFPLVECNFRRLAESKKAGNHLYVGVVSMHEMKTKLREPTVFHKTAATIPANKNQIVPHGADHIFFSHNCCSSRLDNSSWPPFFFFFSNDGLIDRSPVSLLPVFSSVFHKEL